MSKLLWKKTAGKGKLTALYKALKENERKSQWSSAGEILWLNDRIRESTLPVRFEIPMDVRKLKEMTVKTYLSEYCKIPRKRKLIYQRFYKKHNPSKFNPMSLKVLPDAIHDLLYNCVSEEEIVKFLSKLNVISFGDLDTHMFAVIAATAERILYLSFAEENHGHISPGALRSFKECADFGALRWKLKDIELQPSLQGLLSSLG